MQKNTIRMAGLGLVLAIGAVLAPGPAFSRQVQASPFLAADEAASQLPRLHSMLIARNGELLFEKYYNGTGPERQANIKSASKSVISALVGIAIDQGLIEGIDQPIGDFFPGSAPGR